MWGAGRRSNGWSRMSWEEADGRAGGLVLSGLLGLGKDFRLLRATWVIVKECGLTCVLERPF